MNNSIIPIDDLPMMENAGPEAIKTEAAATPDPSNKQHPNMANPMFDQHGQRNAQPWHPWADVGRVSEKCTSELAQQARDLYEAWQKRIVDHSNLVSESREAEKVARAFPRQINDAILQAVDAGGADVVSSVAAKAQEYKAAMDAADPQIWRKLVMASDQAVENARAELQGFLDENWAQLVEDHRADAERVSKAWKKAHDAARKTLAPLEKEHDELVGSLAVIVGRTEPFTRESLHPGVYDPQNGYGESPVPSPAEITAAQ
jgi:hypothetical protein